MNQKMTFFLGQYKNVKPGIKQIEINCNKENIDSYYSMSRNQLINLILPTLKPAFKIKKVIDK